MKVVLRLIRYVVALALFAAGALLVGIHVGAVLKGAPAAPEGAGVAARALDLLMKALAGTPESPVWHIAPGLALAALGLIVARPPVRLTFATKKPPEVVRSLRTVVHELTHPDDAVRLKAAKTLTRLAKPTTIPAFIKALLDKTSEVRGQACEALEGMTGLTFDFVDIAPEAVRKESVRQWLTWWQANKAAIIAGADPKTLGGGATSEAAGGDDAALPRPDGVPGVARVTPLVGENEVVRDPTPLPGSLGGVGRRPPGAASRNLSVGELVRRKRERTPLPGTLGALGALGGTGDAARDALGPPSGVAPPAPSTPAASAPSDSGASGKADDPDAAEEFLPPPDEDLPPPE